MARKAKVSKVSATQALRGEIAALRGEIALLRQNIAGFCDPYYERRVAKDELAHAVHDLIARHMAGQYPLVSKLKSKR